ncbi:MAG: glycosyltransferase [Thermomicrobiales bacterium]
MATVSHNILLYGMDYWPDSTGIAPYTTALAEHLHQCGDTVTVKTGVPYYPKWAVPSEYRRTIRRSEERHGVMIHRYRQYVPARQSALQRLGYEGSFLANAALSRAGDKPDVVVGILPALADGVLAAMASRRHQVPMVLVVQDLMGSAAEQSGVSGGAKVAAATSALEGWICRQAAAIGVVATGFRDRLISLGVSEDRIHLTRNWSHIDQPNLRRDDVRAQLGLPHDRFIALHAGNMGLKQGLDHVIRTARLAKALSNEYLFVLMGDGNQRQRLQAEAAGLDNVRFIDPQREELFPSILAASDALLLNQLPTVTDMSLPSKLTSYFSVGRPVVAAVSRQSEAASVILESGGGTLVSPTDPMELLDELHALAATPQRAKDIGERGKAYVESHLSAEAGLSRLENLIHGVYRAPDSNMKGYSVA